MTTVLNVVVPILAAVCLLGALVFLVKGVRSRGGVPERAYGVERQEARHGMLVAFLRGAGLLFLALIIAGIYGLSVRPEVAGTTITPTALESATSTPAATSTTEPTQLPPVVQEIPPSPTSPLPTPTGTPTLTPVPTATPDIPSAVVNSPNGLWLREAPGGIEELELIPDGAALTLLEGLETADDLEWQQVRTPAGNEGWVAVDFIVYQ